MTLLLLVALACAFAAGWFTCLGLQDLRRVRALEAERLRESLRVAAYAEKKIKERGWPIEYDIRNDMTPWGERSRPGQ